MRQADNECDIPCNVLWDGFGRWVAGYTWKPYINSTRNGTSYFRNPRENGYKLWARWFLGLFGCISVSYVWSMVSKATIIVNYIAHPNDPRNPFAESLYSLRLSEVCGVTSLSKKLYASHWCSFSFIFLQWRLYGCTSSHLLSGISGSFVCPLVNRCHLFCGRSLNISPFISRKKSTSYWKLWFKLSRHLSDASR